MAFKYYCLKQWPEVMLIWWLLLETEWSEVMLIWWFVSIKSIKSFLKFSFFNIFIQTIPLVISISLEKLSPLPSTDIIMVTLFCFSSVFFSSERYHFLFFFYHFFNKMVKPKCKTPFSKFIFAIFLISGIQH